MDIADSHEDGVIESFASDCFPALAQSQWCRKVTDADEEVFLLYTLSAPPPDWLGLGQIDDQCDALRVTIDLSNIDKAPIVRHSVDGEEEDEQKPAKAKGKRRHGSHVQSQRMEEHVETLSRTIRQNSTSLRSSAGDTGSVVWRSSVYLAARIAQGMSASVQAEARPRIDPSYKDTSIVALGMLRRARIVELGAGTGILPSLILAHPCLQTPSNGTQWIATDQPAITSLLRKNLQSIPASRQGLRMATAVALDWLEASNCYRFGSASAIKKYRDSILVDPFRDDHAADPADEVDSRGHADLIFATDCIFNPHLFAPFVDTLTLCSTPGRTLTLVACELRQADMMRDFIQTWLDHPGKWTIYTIEDQSVLGPFLAQGSVVWLAWRSE